MCVYIYIYIYYNEMSAEFCWNSTVRNLDFDETLTDTDPGALGGATTTRRASSCTLIYI